MEPVESYVVCVCKSFPQKDDFCLCADDPHKFFSYHDTGYHLQDKDKIGNFRMPSQVSW